MIFFILVLKFAIILITGALFMSCNLHQDHDGRKCKNFTDAILVPKPLLPFCGKTGSLRQVVWVVRMACNEGGLPMKNSSKLPLSSTYCPTIPPIPTTPAGLEALYAQCRKLYPNQPNPLQVTAVVKYWLGGPDPLDYISMYANSGDVDRGIPPHWHYISFGLSDLHGDGRVHEVTDDDTPSGFGFELSFRLKQEPQETAPPTWPATIMQALAKYVFQSENRLCTGDHISWHCPLDNSESRIQHMLTTEDPQLGTTQTPFGPVTFVQIVGVCGEELQAAQHWNGPGVTELMKKIPGAGSPWLVTDMRRGETIFDLDPQVEDAVDQGIELEGSNLSGVNARCSWAKSNSEKVDLERSSPDNRTLEGDDEPELPEISQIESEQIKVALKKGLQDTKPVIPPVSSKEKSSAGHLSHTSNLKMVDNNPANDIAENGPSELLQTQTLDAVHLSFNLEAGALLPLALRGRLKHGRHFTFKGVVGDVAITFVPPSVTGAFVTEENPYASLGGWLQVYLDEENIDDMLNDFEILAYPDKFSLPKLFTWPGKGLTIAVTTDDY